MLGSPDGNTDQNADLLEGMVKNTSRQGLRLLSYNTIKDIGVFELWRENIGQKKKKEEIIIVSTFFPLDCTDIFTECKIRKVQNTIF